MLTMASSLQASPWRVCDLQLWSMSRRLLHPIPIPIPIPIPVPVPGSAAGARPTCSNRPIKAGAMQGLAGLAPHRDIMTRFRIANCLLASRTRSPAGPPPITMAALPPSEANSPSSAPKEDDSQADVGQPAAKKRRTATSRGVANLTPEQLARKRANDREAQRAIRERTKTQIDRLNQRIRDLESQQPYHDLQVVLRDKDAVQAENADIRKRLESVMGIIQPILRASGGLNGQCRYCRAHRRS